MLTEHTLQTNSGQYNAGTKQMQLLHEELNATLNFRKLNIMLNNGRAKDIADEPLHSEEACIIIGSGASLEAALPLLHNWKGGLICTTSHALTLVHHGAPPTHIVALDPFCVEEEIVGIDWTKYNTKLVTTPTVWPSLIDYWPNEMLLYRQSMGQPQSFYGSVLNHIYCTRAQITKEEGMALCEKNNTPYDTFNGARAFKFIPRIKTEVTLFACSPPTQLFIAHLMGYKGIFLSGCDFGFTYGKDRFTNWTVENDVWTAHENPIVEANIQATSANGIPSAGVHLYYKKNMLSAIRLLLNDDPNVQLMTTDHGTITELPYVDIAHVIEKQGKHIQHVHSADLIDNIENYMASINAHCLLVDTGKTSPAMMFIETRDAVTELTAYMKRINLAYFCEYCKVDLIAPDDGKDHTDNECPQCKKPALKRKSYADIDKNIERVQKRIIEGEKLKVSHANN